MLGTFGEIDHLSDVRDVDHGAEVRRSLLEPRPTLRLHEPSARQSIQCFAHAQALAPAEQIDGGRDIRIKIDCRPHVMMLAS